MMKKFNFKKFFKDHAREIGYAIGGAIALGAGGLWLLHVKRNTEELFKFDIPEGKCYDHYRQFGKTYLNAEASMKSAPVFIKELLESGNFNESDKVFFMITDDEKVI